MTDRNSQPSVCIWCVPLMIKLSIKLTADKRFDADIKSFSHDNTNFIENNKDGKQIIISFARFMNFGIKKCLQLTFTIDSRNINELLTSGDETHGVFTGSIIFDTNNLSNDSEDFTILVYLSSSLTEYYQKLATDKSATHLYNNPKMCMPSNLITQCNNPNSVRKTVFYIEPLPEEPLIKETPTVGKDYKGNRVLIYDPKNKKRKHSETSSEKN